MNSPDIAHPAYDISKEYDIYYEGGKDSIYNKRFGENKITPREYSLITNNLKNSINKFLKKRDNKNHKYKILDFGCGDGRLFGVLKDIAEYYKEYELDFDIVCYDISLTGLRELKKSLLSDNYSLETNSNKDEYTSLLCNLNKDNIKVHLIYGSSDDSISCVKHRLGFDYDSILCMFGVLAHIPKFENRQNIISMFEEILIQGGKLLLSVPSSQMFRQEQNTFNELRLSNEYDKLKLAVETGDLYYKVKNSDIYNFYHIFNYGELENNIKNADLKHDNTLIYSILHPSTISKNFFVLHFDNIIAYILSLNIFSKSLCYKLSKYILTVATKE